MNIIIYRQITIWEELVLKPVISRVKVHSVQHAMKEATRCKKNFLDWGNITISGLP